MSDGFRIKFTGHERMARKLLLKKGLKTADELAVMSAPEIEQAINAEFEATECGEDWLLVPRDKWPEFQVLVTWIER